MRYVIRERFIHVGEDPNITDESGRVLYQVDGKVLSLRDFLILCDPAGMEVARVQRKLWPIFTAGNPYRCLALYSAQEVLDDDGYERAACCSCTVSGRVPVPQGARRAVAVVPC